MSTDEIYRHNKIDRLLAPQMPQIIAFFLGALAHALFTPFTYQAYYRWDETQWQQATPEQRGKLVHRLLNAPTDDFPNVFNKGQMEVPQFFVLAPTTEEDHQFKTLPDKSPLWKLVDKQHAIYELGKPDFASDSGLPSISYNLGSRSDFYQTYTKPYRLNLYFNTERQGINCAALEYYRPKGPPL